MKSFHLRLISAVAAIIIIGLLYYFLGAFAFKVLVATAVVLGSFEVSHLLFQSDKHSTLRYLFHLLTFALAYISYEYFFLSGNFLALAFLLYTCFAILLSKRFEKIDELKHWILSGIAGLFYVGFLPVFVGKLLDLPMGMYWFLALLIVVFAGDIGAYLFGVAFGKKKIFPSLSPKKSWMGSIGGLLFSGLAAIVISKFLFHFNNQFTVAFLALSLVSAIFAQLGDFFESLLKRVADVKDSGKIMPGHGGILDRIDGVLFAGPIFYLGAVILQHFLISVH
ncbi:MAG: phosphatidate cytidylyltransferase [Bdellovibrionia bacterium]